MGDYETDYKIIEHEYEELDKYTEEYEREIKYLDSLDILPLLKKGIHLEELIEKLESLYGDEYEGNNMFDCITLTDLIDYLEDRFNVSFVFSSISYFYLNTDIQKHTRYAEDDNLDD